MLAGPFFMFTPNIYNKVGSFDDRFLIVGDFDWCLRAAQITESTPSETSTGRTRFVAVVVVKADIPA